jgi:hypothetical protein
VRGPPRDVDDVGPGREQAAFVDLLARRVDGRQAVRRGEADDRPSILLRRHVCVDDERLDAITLQPREGRLEIGRPAQTDRHDAHAERAGRALRFFRRQHRVRVVGIPEHAHPGDLRRELAEQLDPFPFELQVERGHPGDVAARMGQAQHDPGLDGISDGSDDDGNGSRRALRRQRRGGTPGVKIRFILLRTSSSAWGARAFPPPP